MKKAVSLFLIFALLTLGFCSCSDKYGLYVRGVEIMLSNDRSDESAKIYSIELTNEDNHISLSDENKIVADAMLQPSVKSGLYDFNLTGSLNSEISKDYKYIKMRFYYIDKSGKAAQTDPVKTEWHEIGSKTNIRITNDDGAYAPYADGVSTDLTYRFYSVELRTY